MLQARLPRKSVRVEPRRVEPGLVEINLVNCGELDISSRLAVRTRWSGARLSAADGVRGFAVTERGASSVRFENPSQRWRLPAGEQNVVGWLRLQEDCEVQVELDESDEN